MEVIYIKHNNSSNVYIKKIKENLSSNLDLPEEIILDLPLVTIIGRSKIIIENFKNILEYSSSSIKLNTSCGVLKLEGSNFFLKELRKTKILVKGNLIKSEFIVGEDNV